MKHERPAVIALLAVHAFLLAMLARLHSPVLDELPHLASGIAIWKTGSFDTYRVNPPLVRVVAAMPVLLAGARTDGLSEWRSGPFDRPEFSLGRQFVEHNGPRVFHLFTLARWACIPFMVLGGYVCYRWSRALFGPIGGVTSLALWCFCPNLLGWGATICPDGPSAAIGLTACYSFWLWFRDATWRRTFGAGACLGLAILSKSTWIILLVVWPLLWLSSLQGPAGTQTSRLPERWPSTSGSAGRILVILLLGLYVLNLGYGFAGSFRPLGEFQFISRSLSGRPSLGEAGNRFRSTLLARLPVPLPADFLIGLDVQRYDFEKGKWSYLRGEQRHGGWYHYYVYALLIKTPVGSLCIIAAGFWATVARGRNRNALVEQAIVLAPAVAIIALVSWHTGFNRYLRYVLPAVPLLYVLAGGAAHWWDAPQGRKISLRAACYACCVASVAAGSLAVWPHSMSYFNALVGGPAYGHRHLLDANLDWGQDLLNLKRWLDSHPEIERLRLAYFGWINPELAGIQAATVPGLLFDDRGRISDGSVDQVIPGWYAVSINHLMGYRHSDNNRPEFTWLREFSPADRVGYSIWIYHLTHEDVETLRGRLQPR